MFVSAPAEPPKQSASIFARMFTWVKQHSSRSTSAAPTSSDSEIDEIEGAYAQAVSPKISAACQRTMKVILDKVIDCMTTLRDQGLRRSTSVSLCSKWVYFTDSGGYPHYHELFHCLCVAYPVPCVSFVFLTSLMRSRLLNTSRKANA